MNAELAQLYQEVLSHLAGEAREYFLSRAEGSEDDLILTRGRITANMTGEQLLREKRILNKLAREQINRSHRKIQKTNQIIATSIRIAITAALL